MYGKDDIDKITDYVETKSRDEVVKYSDVFYNGKHDSFPQLKNTVANTIKQNNKIQYQKT